MQSQRGTTVQLAGGLVGVKQADDLTLSAKTGWAVRRESSFEDLLSRFLNSPHIQITKQSAGSRFKLSSFDLQLNQFYHRFETLHSTNSITCHFSAPAAIAKIREKPPVKLLAQLDGDRWLGTVEIVNLEAVKAMFERGERLRTAFFIGDTATRQKGGEADFIGLNFGTVLSTLLDAIESETAPDFEIVGRIDPQDEESLSALFPT